jgi:hypothetical protein
MKTTSDSFYQKVKILIKKVIVAKNKNIGGQSNYSIKFDATIKMFTKIKEINSYGYEVNSEINKRKATVSFSTDLKDIEQFYLNITLNKHTKLRNWVEERNLNDKKTKAIMTVIPADTIKKEIGKIKAKDTEIVFLVDKSGSMFSNNKMNMVNKITKKRQKTH